MKQSIDTEKSAAITGILSALELSARKGSPSAAEKAETTSFKKTTFSVAYYIYVTTPIWFSAICLPIFWLDNDPTSLYLYTIVLTAIYLFLFLGMMREFKTIEAVGRDLLFRYSFLLPARLIRYNDYDGYLHVWIQVTSDRGTRHRIYLVKDHRRKESINPAFYKNEEELITELEKHLKELGSCDKGFFTHFFGGGKLKY